MVLRNLCVTVAKHTREKYDKVAMNTNCQKSIKGMNLVGEKHNKFKTNMFGDCESQVVDVLLRNVSAHLEWRTSTDEDTGIVNLRPDLMTLSTTEYLPKDIMALPRMVVSVGLIEMTLSAICN